MQQFLFLSLIDACIPYFSTMKNSADYYEKENECTEVLQSLGQCYHLWTPENFEIIFTCDDEFRAGMNIIGISALICSDIKILTFVIMSNHIHITICGDEAAIIRLFNLIKGNLVRVFRARTIDWDSFREKHRHLQDLNDVRNVIVYDNRNGYLVTPSCSPFTYPWGANRYYFNPDAERLALSKAVPVTFREKRKIMRSHIADSISGLMMFDGYALPLSFCDVKSGERLFRSASNYFYRLGRSIESQKAIAGEIGESVFYTDDELFSIIKRMANERYNNESLGQLPPACKIDLAKAMRYDYNASVKQISRLTKLSQSTLASLGIID